MWSRQTPDSDNFCDCVRPDGIKHTFFPACQDRPFLLWCAYFWDDPYCSFAFGHCATLFRRRMQANNLVLLPKESCCCKCWARFQICKWETEVVACLDEYRHTRKWHESKAYKRLETCYNRTNEKVVQPYILVLAGLRCGRLSLSQWSCGCVGQTV